MQAGETVFAPVWRTIRKAAQEFMSRENALLARLRKRSPSPEPLPMNTSASQAELQAQQIAAQRTYDMLRTWDAVFGPNPSVKVVPAYPEGTVVTETAPVDNTKM